VGGITKINIFTAMAVKARDNVVAHAAEPRVSIQSITNQIADGFYTEACHCLDVFGTGAKA